MSKVATYRLSKGYKGSTLVSQEQRHGYNWLGPAETRPPMNLIGSYFYTQPGPGKREIGCTSTSTRNALHYVSRPKDLAKQRAWARFRDSCYDTASLGVSLAEIRESANLIGFRSKQLATAFLALKKGDFRRFAGVLRIRPHVQHKRTGWTRPKDASSLWLEYWMGWAPMVGDIYDAAEVLTKEIPSVKVTAYASAPIRDTYKYKAGSVDHTGYHSGAAGVKYQGRVLLKNPNLARLEQLGLTNPAVVAWELVPFSFIINWFVPVQSMLASYSFGIGMDIVDKEMTERVRMKGSEIFLLGNQVEFSNTSEVATFNRVVGNYSLPPRLLFDPPTRLSITRAATAVGLLISIFSKG